MQASRIQCLQPPQIVDGGYAYSSAQVGFQKLLANCSMLSEQHVTAVTRTTIAHPVGPLSYIGYTMLYSSQNISFWLQPPPDKDVHGLLLRYMLLEIVLETSKCAK